MTEPDYNSRSRLDKSTARFADSTRQLNRLMSSALRTGRHIVQATQNSPVSRSLIKSYLAFTLFIAGLTICLLLLVKVRVESYRLGYEVMELRREKHQLEEKLHTLRTDHARLRSYPSLLQMNSSLGLYLLPPEKRIKDK